MQVSFVDFERLFDAILIPTERPGRPEAPRRQGPAPDQEGRIQAAVALFHRGEYARCMAGLRDLSCGQDPDPRVVAYLSAARAMSLGEVRGALKACLEAVKRGFYLPEVYSALGAVLLKAGDRSRAHAAFRRGLRVDPKHPHLLAQARAMGVRRSPVLRFLKRSHPLNRALGILRASVTPA